MGREAHGEVDEEGAEDVRGAVHGIGQHDVAADLETPGELAEGERQVHEGGAQHPAALLALRRADVTDARLISAVGGRGSGGHGSGALLTPRTDRVRPAR